MLKRIFDTIVGIVSGKGVSSIDRAKRKEQIRDRDDEDEKIKDAVEGGDVDGLNDLLGFGTESDE